MNLEWRHQARILVMALIASTAIQAEAGRLLLRGGITQQAYEQSNSFEGLGPDSLQQRRLLQSGGCIQYDATGCPEAYPTPSCCQLGAAGPTRCALLAVECTRAKYCCINS